MGIISAVVLDDDESWLGVSEKNVALKKVKFIESVVKRVIEDDDDHFDIINSEGMTRLFVSLTGKKLISAIYGVRIRDYPVGYFGNLYLNALVEVVGDVFNESDVIHEYGDYEFVRRSFYSLSSVVSLLRGMASSYSFHKK